MFKNEKKLSKWLTNQPVARPRHVASTLAIEMTKYDMLGGSGGAKNSSINQKVHFWGYFSIMTAAKTL